MGCGPSSFEWLKLQSCIGVKQHDQKASDIAIFSNTLGRQASETSWHPGLCFLLVQSQWTMAASPAPQSHQHTHREGEFDRKVQDYYDFQSEGKNLLPTYIPSARVPECSFMGTFLPIEKWRSYKYSFDCSHLILRLGLASAQAEKSQGTWFLKLAVTQITQKIFR